MFKVFKVNARIHIKHFLFIIISKFRQKNLRGVLIYKGGIGYLSIVLRHHIWFLGTLRCLKLTRRMLSERLIKKRI